MARQMVEAVIPPGLTRPIESALSGYCYGAVRILLRRCHGARDAAEWRNWSLSRKLIGQPHSRLPTSCPHVVRPCYCRCFPMRRTFHSILTNSNRL